jgi:DNA repair protein RadC
MSSSKLLPNRSRKQTDLETDQRPRERILRQGPEGLSDSELLAVVLGSGSAGQTALQVADSLAGSGTARLACTPARDLLRTRGVGPARAAALAAAFELGRRAASAPGPSVTSPEEVWCLVADMAGLRKEHFRALYLDARRRLLQTETVSIGTLTSSLVHPREVFQPAVAHSAAAVVVAHNHPSGDPEPSPEDLALTRRLRQAGEILGIEILDHLVVGRGRFVSLKQRGVL